MNIQNLVREKIIANIKTGTKGENGLPQKLPYFNVEEDKVTSSEMVDIFKQLYPNKPTKLIIKFTSENPFNFKFKRYIKGKVVCIGNDTKAITIGKDAKGNNTQIEIECNENCEQRRLGKCKLVGSLKFILDGIDAGGVWKINTSGGFSLSNIATEIMKYRKAGISIVDVPFELSLSAQESLAYGTYYSIDLKRLDAKPQLIEMKSNILEIEKEEKDVKQLPEGEKANKKVSKKTKTDNNEKTTTDKILDNKQNMEIIEPQDEKNSTNKNYLVVKKFIQTIINKTKFDQIIFEDFNSQEVEYVLHPKANQEILTLGKGTLIELVSSQIENKHNILCKYNIIKYVDSKGNVIECNNEVKKAV